MRVSFPGQKQPGSADARQALPRAVEARRTASVQPALIRLGVCAMDKKAGSRPMTAILGRLGSGFEVVKFGDDTLLHVPVAEWPICDVLISFFSTGFPLEKAKAYVALRRPHCACDLDMQHLTLDRRKIYATLAAAGVSTPRHAVLERDPATGAVLNASVVEGDDWIEIDGERITKPFVEKPVDAEDHNVYIYYPASAGGGSKRLFRKVGDKPCTD